MSLSDKYRELATLIDALESKGIAVREASPVGGDGQGGAASDRFSVQLVVDLPNGTVTEESDDEPVDEQSRQRAQDAAERANGRDETEAAGDDDAPAADDSETDGANAADGTNAVGDGIQDTNVVEDSETDDTDIVDCTHPDCARTFETERGMKIHRTKAHPLSEIIDPDATGAVHQDPEALADVYDQYETFAEMTEALDADVGAQAVRKQMIRHGIHEPEGQAPGEGTSGAVGVQTLATDADRDGDDPDRPTGSANGDTGNGTTSKNGVGGSDDPDDRDAADDPDDRDAADDPDDRDAADDPDAEESVAARLPELDLPGDLTTAELKTAVETANTLYDVQRALDLDSETTRDVLSEYDLLELVSGRAASVRDREELKSEIHERLRRTAA
jgi:hypothetical protein